MSETTRGAVLGKGQMETLRLARRIIETYRDALDGAIGALDFLALSEAAYDGLMKVAGKDGGDAPTVLQGYVERVVGIVNIARAPEMDRGDADSILTSRVEESEKDKGGLRMTPITPRLDVPRAATAEGGTTR